MQQGEEDVATLSLVSLPQPLTPTSPTPPSNIAHQVVDARLEEEEIKTAPHNYSNSMMASSDGGGGSVAEVGSAVSKAPLLHDPARSNVILAKEVQQGLVQASASRSSSRFAGSKLRRKGVQEEPARAPSSLAPHPVDCKMAMFRSGSYRLDRRATSANVATPSWRPDKEVKECQGCKARFTLVKRRHHCRSCGDIFCEDCSSHSISVSSLYLLQSDHSLAASTCSSRLSQPASSLSSSSSSSPPSDAGDGDGDDVENAAIVTDATTPTTNSSARKRSVVRVCDGCWIKVQMMLDGRGALERAQKRTDNSNTTAAWRNSFRLSKKSRQATGPLHRSSDSHRSVGGKSDPSTGVGPALTGTRNRTSAKQSSQMALHRSHSTLSTSTSTLSSAPLSAAAAAAALARRGRSRGPGAAANATSGAQVPPEWQRIAKEKQEAGKRMVARHQVAMEILNTEKTYVKNLSLVVRGLLVPLRQANNVLNEEQIQGVFLNLEELLNEHTSFLVLLEKRINQWNADATVADLFLNHTEFLLKYEVYMKEYSTSQILLSYLLEKYPAFLKAKGDFETKTNGLSLEDFLIQPIQRLPRYCLLLERMQAYTAPKTIAYEEIKCAHAKVERVLANLHQGIAQDQSQANASVKKLLSLEQSLSQLLSQDLYSTKRRFVRESAVWWSLHVQDAAQNMGRTVREKADTDTADIVLDNFCSTQQHTLYLFNDMILCCGNVTIDSFANQQAERERKEKERKEQKLLEVDTKAKDSTQTINQRSNNRNQGENNPTREPIAATDESRELPSNVPVAAPSDMDDSSNHQKQVEPAPPTLLPTSPPTSSLEEEESLWLEQVPFAVVLNLNNVATIRDGYGGGLEGGSSYGTGVFLGTSPRNRHSQLQPRHYHDLQNTSPLSLENDAVNPNSFHLDSSSSAADATKSGKLQTVDATSSQSLIPEVAASHPLAGSYKAPSAFAAFQQHQISKESEVTTPPALGTEPVFPVAATPSVGLNRQNGMPLMARKPSCVFQVWTAKECWNIYFSTEEEKNLWLTDITKCIHDLLVQKYNLF